MVLERLVVKRLKYQSYSQNSKSVTSQTLKSTTKTLQLNQTTSNYNSRNLRSESFRPKPDLHGPSGGVVERSLGRRHGGSGFNFLVERFKEICLEEGQDCEMEASQHLRLRRHQHLRHRQLGRLRKIGCPVVLRSCSPGCHCGGICFGFMALSSFPALFSCHC